MGITKKDVEHLADLAQLEFSEAELKVYLEQLNDILTHLQKINELTTDDVEPTTHILPIKNVFREDVVEKGLDRDEVLKTAPAQEKGQFKVPRII